jgi:hypothetical protein
MASSWGTGAGSTIPNPSTVKRNEELVGAQYIVADGSMVTDAVTYRWRWDLTWLGVSDSEKNIIRGKAILQSTQTLTVPGIAGASVEPIRGTYREDAIGYTPAFNISCSVRSTST